ncbi:MAG: hypothetical protein A2675_01905 [Candidatus Yonathbacteria bacterium RIFCSPHIGHO2_01_FULL_51_10]|uniref:Uncharacterized protein n=1 Tax=Candidatus Yonathbacteria bacterium RIFCSPHIGHO2_01_FULL_51_10 TaxID=1802723 RepID=A0A1G2SAY0_9BACT|nr:MAG: hypothetical protein A2675_01905 [Candidatus Yonathbacteria bacterium RIFCSPHIGHO2_01_FULL_51_10]
MKTTKSAAASLREPCGAEGAFALALREAFSAPSEERRKELFALAEKLKGPPNFREMFGALSCREERAWALLFARFAEDEGNIRTHLTRCPNLAEKQPFIGIIGFNLLREASPFHGSRVTIIGPRHPLSPGDPREVFKDLIAQKLLECDTNNTYVLVYGQFDIQSAEIFCFHPAELVLDI